jgi:hypothetical protein
MSYLYLSTRHEAVLRAHRLWGPRRWRAPRFARAAQELVDVGLLVECSDGWTVTPIGELAFNEHWGAVDTSSGVPKRAFLPEAGE